MQNMDWILWGVIVLIALSYAAQCARSKITQWMQCLKSIYKQGKQTREDLLCKDEQIIEEQKCQTILLRNIYHLLITAELREINGILDFLISRVPIYVQRVIEALPSTIPPPSDQEIERARERIVIALQRIKNLVPSVPRHRLEKLFHILDALQSQLDNLDMQGISTFQQGIDRILEWIHRAELQVQAVIQKECYARAQKKKQCAIKCDNIGGEGSTSTSGISND